MCKIPMSQFPMQSQLNVISYSLWKIEVCKKNPVLYKRAIFQLKFSKLWIWLAFCLCGKLRPHTLDPWPKKCYIRNVKKCPASLNVFASIFKSVWLNGAARKCFNILSLLDHTRQSVTNVSPMSADSCPKLP